MRDALESATQGKAHDELVKGFIAFHCMVCAFSGNVRLMRGFLVASRLR